MITPYFLIFQAYGLNYLKKDHILKKLLPFFMFFNIYVTITRFYLVESHRTKFYGYLRKEKDIKSLVTYNLVMPAYY